MGNYGWVIMGIWGATGLVSLLRYLMKLVHEKKILESKLEVATAKLKVTTARIEAAKAESHYWYTRLQKLTKE